MTTWKTTLSSDLALGCWSPGKLSCVIADNWTCDLDCVVGRSERTCPRGYPRSKHYRCEEKRLLRNSRQWLPDHVSSIALIIGNTFGGAFQDSGQFGSKSHNWNHNTLYSVFQLQNSVVDTLVHEHHNRPKHSGGSEFESQPRERPFWVKIFTAFLSHLLSYYLKICHDRFLTNYF